MNPHLHIIIIYSPWLTLRFTLDVVRIVHSIGFNMSPMLNFIALKILSSPLIYSFLPTQPPQIPGNHWPLHSSVVMLFPDCHSAAIIQSVAFSDLPGFCFIFSPSKIHLSFFPYLFIGCLQNLVIMHKAAINILHGFLHGNNFSVLVGKYQGAWRLDHMARLHLALLETTQQSSKVAVSFAFPLAMSKSFCCSICIF